MIIMTTIITMTIITSYEDDWTLTFVTIMICGDTTRLTNRHPDEQQDKEGIHFKNLRISH